MDKRIILGSIIAVAVLILVSFTGVVGYQTTKPSTIAKASMVEFTTEVCGLNGGKHTVQLSKTKAEEVEQLFDSIKERLDEVKNREETVKIFKEVVVELDKYGLLDGLSVRQAQRLVTIRYQHPFHYRVFNRLYKRIMMLDENENLQCQIAGKTTVTRIVGIPFLFPIKFFNKIDYGHGYFKAGIVEVPASGWVYTDGLNGIITWNKSFYGQYSKAGQIWPDDAWWYRGAIGFTGISIIYGILVSIHFTLGTARSVKLGPNPLP